MTKPVISFNGLGFAYRPGRWIFRNYSAAVKRGSVFAILGPNGRGKTTLLKLVLGAETDRGIIFRARADGVHPAAFPCVL